MSHDEHAIRLEIHDIVWSQERGHPVLVLRVADVHDEFISIVISPTDAQALSGRPACDCVDRLRLAGLIEVLLHQFDCRVSAVHLTLDAFSILRGELLITQGDRDIRMPVNIADAALLGGRSKASFSISLNDLTAIRRLRDGAATAPQPIPGLVRAFIDSLPTEDQPST